MVERNYTTTRNVTPRVEVMQEVEVIQDTNTAALVVSWISLSIAILALAWSPFQHWLSGGRLRVSLDSVIWDSLGGVFSRDSGVWELPADNSLKWQPTRYYFEAARVTVANRGRLPVSISVPVLRVGGTGNKHYTIGLPMLPAGIHEPPKSGEQSTYRIEPYGAISFMFDYWPSVQAMRPRSVGNELMFRAQVRTLGTGKETRSPRGSSWHIPNDRFSSRATVVALPHDLVAWRHLVMINALFGDENDKAPVSIGSLDMIMMELFERFEETPSKKDFLKEFQAVANTLKINTLNKYWSVGCAYSIYNAIERYPGPLEPWTGGLSHKRTSTDTSSTSEG